jgi:hypothetical protein
MQTTPFRELAPAVVVVVVGLSLVVANPEAKSHPLKLGRLHRNRQQHGCKRERGRNQVDD